MRLICARAVTVALAVLGGAGAMAFPKLIIGEAIPPKEPILFAAPVPPDGVTVIRVPRSLAFGPTPRRPADERPKPAPRPDAPQLIAFVPPAPAPSRPAPAPAPAVAPPEPPPSTPTPEPAPAPSPAPDPAPDVAPAPAPAPTPAPVPNPPAAPTAPGPTTTAPPPAPPVAAPSPVVPPPPPLHHPAPSPLHPAPPVHTTPAPLHPITVTVPTIRTLSSTGHSESEPATDVAHGHSGHDEYDESHDDLGVDQHTDQAAALGEQSAAAVTHIP